MSLEEFESFSCPYCGQTNQLQVDLSGGRRQEFVVDCEVCCAPIIIRIQVESGEIVSIDIQREND